MSVYLLNHPGSPSTIPDELESFLHVYVYGAVRRLRSNLVTIDGFMNTYFSGCEINHLRAPVCPSSKRDSVVQVATLRSGEDIVTFSDPDGTVVEHPVNDLISQLLNRFRSRYVVLNAQNSKTTHSVDPRTPVIKKTTLDPDPRRRLERRHPGLPDLKALIRSKTGAIPEPLQEDFDNADSLDDHTAVLGLFLGFLEHMTWPRSDVIPDRLSEAVELRKVLQATQAAGTVAPTEAEPTTANAATKSDAHAPEGTAAVPVPAVDAPVTRPTKRRRKEPIPAPAEQPIAGPSTGRLTRSRSAAMVVAVPTTAVAQPPVATRVTRSQSGALPPYGGHASGTSLGRTRRGTERSNTLTRTASGRGRGRAQARSSTLAGPSNGGDVQAGSKDSKGKGVAGRSRRR